MKSKRKKNITVGLFVTIGLLLFIGIIYYIGTRQSLFGSNVQLTARFNNVSGLQSGNNVRFSGIKIGVVREVSLVSDSMAQVLMYVDEEASQYITRQAVASIETDGLMGNKIITISNVGKGGEPVRTGDRLRTREPMDIGHVISSIKQTSDQAEELTSNLNEISKKIKNAEGLLGKVISDTTMANRVENLMASLENTGRNAAQITSELEQTTTAINQGDGLLTKVIYKEDWSQDVGTTIDSLRLAGNSLKQSSQELERFMEKLNNNKGVVNRLLNDTIMANDLKATLKNIEEGTQELDDVMNTVENSWLLNFFSGDDK